MGGPGLSAWWSKTAFGVRCLLAAGQRIIAWEGHAGDMICWLRAGEIAFASGRVARYIVCLERGLCMGTDVDVLAEAARSVQNKVGEQSLWKAVMALRTWYFVAQGQGADAEPMVASVEGRPQLLAFTEEER